MQTSTSVNDYLRDHIRTVPDWPQSGIQFRDITPLLQDKKTFRVLVDVFVHRYMDQGLNYVAGVDARGFILGAVVAYELNLGFIPVRKKGKLPYQTVEEEYELEYGSATVEIHTDACGKGDRILLIDDLVDTGNTARVIRKLLPKAYFATLYAKPMGRDVVDLCVKEFSQDKWIYFPWDIDYKFVPPIKKNV